MLVAIVGLTINAISAEGYSTKYKTKTLTGSYSSGVYLPEEKFYYWDSKDAKYSNPTILEYRSGSKTKLKVRIYNNNGNEFHHTDCRSSKITLKYKVVTSKSTISKTKTYTYNNIPKYGVIKTITISGPKNSKILISSMKQTQTHRVWY